MATERPALRRLLRWYSLFALLPAGLISLAGLAWILLFRAGVVSFDSFTQYRWLKAILLGPGRRIPEEWCGYKVLVFWMEAPDDALIQELAIFTTVDFLAWVVVLTGIFFLGRFWIWALRAVRRRNPRTL